MLLLSKIASDYLYKPGKVSGFRCLHFVFFTFCFYASFAQNGIINGIVKDGETVLQSATVLLSNKNTLTNSAGEFSIVINPGKYKLLITHVGYKNVEQPIIINAGETKSFQFNMIRDEEMGEVVVLGSRSSIQRSNMNTAVPVDVIRGSQLPTGEIGITKQLINLVPAFNSPIQTLSPATVTNPAGLRGLGSDEMLVLLNGRRRHTTSNIFTNGMLGYGTVCTDLNAIPSAAIEKIEVLRDGAAAQYGSDGIAGVMNLQLKKSTGKTYINFHLGQYYKGDGETVLLDVNRGFQLNKKGFLNLTVALGHSNPTQRNGVYDSTVYYNIPASGVSERYKDSIRALDNQKVAERGFDRYNFRRIGNSEILNTSFVLNGDYPLSKKTNLFWTGTMNYRIGDDRTNPVYRYPKDTTTVNTELYPDGFQAYVLSKWVDYSLVGGIEGKTSNGWYWDISSVYGSSSARSTISNSNNASQFAIGKNAQTSFKNGGSNFNQNTNNINFTRDFAKYFQGIKSLTASLGGEFRVEHYSIKAGEEASWKNYAPSSGRLGGSQPPGNSDTNVVSKNRYITAAYAELEMDKNEKLLWNIAGRYEYYSDFGGNLAGKIAMRYKFSNRFMLRSSFGNGFRAPAIQQRYYSSTSYTGGRNFFGISVIGTYRNDSKVAEAFGVTPLEAERSLDASIGFTLKISRHINLTLDAYWIQVSNRVILTGSIQRSATVPRVGEILDSLNHREIMAVRFFTNAVSTRTKGLDLVVSGKWPIKKSFLEISLAGNYNKTNIYRVDDPAKNLPDDSVYQYTLINPEDRGRLEQSNPLAKVIVAAKYKTGKWEFGARSIYNGKVAHIFFGPDRSRDQFFTPKIISSFNVSYSLKTWIIIGAGANNIFNVYPDRINNRLNSQGGLLIYDGNSTQIGYNGGYYFINMEFHF